MITKPIQFARNLEGSGSRNQAASQNLLTAEEVAAQTGLSVETLAQWRSQRRGIPYIKISRNCVRYRQCDLDDWLSERIVRTDQDVPNTRGSA
jgi:predicted DNA-binding transcriptional regulator AlpA